MIYKATDLKNGYTKLTFEHKGITEVVGLETENYMKIKDFELYKMPKRNIIYLYFKDEKSGKNIYLHRYFANPVEGEYTYHVSDNWRDLRMSNFINDRPGAKKSPKFMKLIENLRSKQTPFNKIFENVGVAENSAKKLQPQINITRSKDTNEIIINSGTKEFSLKGLSEKQTLEIISKVILTP